jgi:hypothetical protein
MLHVTNGHSVSLRDAGVEGEILFWVDVLHEGPVPAELDDAELCRVRSEFLDAGTELEERDRTLAAHQEIVLWFEHDLYDQLQLIQILDRCRGSGKRVELIATNRYLGMMTGSELAALWPTRHAVTEAEYARAARAWTAFRSPDPMDMQAVIANGGAALPYLNAALRRQLEQFPSVENGLGRTERQILAVLAEGPRSFGELFRAQQQREEAVFMGDTSLLAYVTALEPLVLKQDGRLAITDAGREVLAGSEDRVRRYGIDRWFGGVHLQGREARWRWDARGSGTLVRSES